jgi:hypothetical protein
MSMGIAFSWTGVGLLNPKLLSTLINGLDNPKLLKVFNEVYFMKRKDN